METQKSDRSLGDLLKELTTESRTLLRQEIALAKVEIGEKVSVLGRNVALIAAGGVAALLGAVALLVAAIYGVQVLLGHFMDDDLAYWLAPVLIGLAVAGLGWMLIQKGIQALKLTDMAPRQTQESLKETGQWMKEKLT